MNCPVQLSLLNCPWSVIIPGQASFIELSGSNFLYWNVHEVWSYRVKLSLLNCAGQTLFIELSMKCYRPGANLLNWIVHEVCSYRVMLSVLDCVWSVIISGQAFFRTYSPLLVQWKVRFSSSNFHSTRFSMHYEMLYMNDFSLSVNYESELLITALMKCTITWGIFPWKRAYWLKMKEQRLK